MPDVGLHRQVSGEQVFCLLHFAQGIGIHLFLLVGQAAIPIGKGVVRIELQGFRELFERPVVLPRVQVVPAEMEVDDRTYGIELESAAALSKGFIPTTAREQKVGIPVTAVGVARIQRKRSLEFRFRSGPISVVGLLHVSERVVRVGDREPSRSSALRGAAFALGRAWLGLWPPTSKEDPNRAKQSAGPL